MATALAAGEKDNFSGVMDFTAPSGGVTKGKTYQIASGVLVVALETAAAAASFAGLVYGCVVATKGTATADVTAVGTKLYHDSTNNVLIVTASGATHCAIALEVTVAATTKVRVLFLQPV